MTIATVADLIQQERSAGSTDEQIATLLRSSCIEPPSGHYRWTQVAVRAAVNEDASGYLRDGRPGTSVR